jgi:DNA polymerase-4
VSSCSYEARKFGVHSAMPMLQARGLCPEAIIIEGSMKQYSYYSALVTSIVRDAAPVVEKASIDEFYLDISGMDRFFRAWKWSQELKKRILKETGLPISFALSTSKTVSKIGTGQAKPNGQLFIEEGNEKSFLAPLSIQKIPMIGAKTFSYLQKIGLSKIADIQALEKSYCTELLGKQGSYLWNKANGIDFSPVEPYHEQKSISSETTFETDILDLRLIHDLLTSISEKLAFSIRKQNKLTGCVSIKIRYAGFETHTQQISIPYTAADHEIIETAHLLFSQHYQKGRPIRLIGLKLSDLISGSYQIRLFDVKPEIHDLYKTMDDIRIKFGSKAIHRATSVGRKRH